MLINSCDACLAHVMSVNIKCFFYMKSPLTNFQHPHSGYTYRVPVFDVALVQIVQGCCVG